MQESPTVIFLHPLDYLFVTQPDPIEHLHTAMEWITERAHRRLDDLATRLG